MNIKVKRYLLLACAVIIVGIGCAFALKSGVGVGAWDALAKSISDVIGIEVGTMGMILNISCVIGQVIILRKAFKWIQILQIPLAVLLGSVVNFVFYELLVFEFQSFFGGIIMFLIASTVCAFGVSVVMVLDEVTFPLEEFCMAFRKIYPAKFHVIRQAVDVLSIIGVFIISYIFSLPLSIGIGTVLGMLTFGPTLGIFMKALKPFLKKRGLLTYE